MHGERASPLLLGALGVLLGALGVGCAANDVRDAEEPLRPGKADLMPHPVNTADAAVAPDEPCCGDGWLCCDGACAPEALIEDMCDPQRADFLVAFGRGPSGCFGLGYSWGYSNSSGYGYTAAGEVRGCSRRTDGLAGEVGGDPEFSCPGVAEHCIVCAVDGPGVELENWLETTRWCDDSDDLPFSLDGIDRGDLGDASVMPGDTQ